MSDLCVGLPHCDPAFLTAWCASVFPKPRTIWWRQNDNEDLSSARNSLPVQDPSLPAQCRSHNDVKSVCPAGFNPLTAQSFGQGHSAAEARPDVRSKGQSIWSHRSRVCMSCDIKSHVTFTILGKPEHSYEHRGRWRAFEAQDSPLDNM